MGTGRSLSSGRSKTGPVGRWGESGRSLSRCPPCLCGAINSRCRARRRFARGDGDVELLRQAQHGDRDRLADALLGHQPVQFVDIADGDAVDRDDEVAARQPGGAGRSVGAVDWMRTPVSRSSSWKRTTRRGNGTFCPATPI